MSKYLTAWVNSDTNEVHSPKGVLAYPTLLEPKGVKGDPNSKPKFSVSLLIPKAANFDALKKLVEDTAKAKFGATWQTKAKKLPILKTIDQEKLADYAEEYPWLVRASSNPDFPPFIFGPDAKPFKGDASDIYSGRHAVISVNAYAYDNVSKGVAFGLQRIQLLDHGEVLAIGRVATASGFEAATDDAPIGASAGDGEKASSDGLWA